MSARHLIAVATIPAFAGTAACAKGESVMPNLDPRGGS
jgi:hypothetical protein